jgi:hypothetical protein
LDCGGKRSATPLWKTTDHAESGVAAALCHRSPKFTPVGKAGQNICAFATLRLCVENFRLEAVQK